MAGTVIATFETKNLPFDDDDDAEITEVCYPIFLSQCISISAWLILFYRLGVLEWGRNLGESVIQSRDRSRLFVIPRWFRKP